MNKYQNEIIDQIDTIIASLITIRTIEADSFNVGKHWSNDYISRLSEMSQSILKGDENCNECFGSGVVYPQFAESNIDAEMCLFCHGVGIGSVNTIKTLFQSILSIAMKNKNDSLTAKIESVLAHPVYN